jgi:hypothetical protein
LIIDRPEILGVRRPGKFPEVLFIALAIHPGYEISLGLHVIDKLLIRVLVIQFVFHDEKKKSQHIRFNNINLV